ncbi:MAG TPA: Abi family protein, partial [Taishania sp.]|nr:Abi family protein [Taishania sp.]
MSKTNYKKAPLTVADQIALLEGRNLTIEDKTKAAAYLNAISYYRLSAYFLPYQQIKDEFNAGVTFKQIINTYSFDRALRLLVFDCIERIEVAIRTQLVYIMSTKYNDSHWQD